VPTVICFRPNFDAVTAYTHVWIGKIADYARKRGYEVIDLEKADATLRNLVDALQNPYVVAVFIGTHGRDNLVVGDLEEPILTACENDSVLTGKISYYGSCLAGRKLAPSTFDKGGTTVVGYTGEFIFHFDPSYTPEDDPIAKPFGDAFVAPVLAILDGLAPSGVFDRTMEAYDKAYAEISRGWKPEDAMMLTALEGNRLGLIIYGEAGVLQVPAQLWPVYLLLAGAAIAVGLAIYKRRERKRWPKVAYAPER